MSVNPSSLMLAVQLYSPLWDILRGLSCIVELVVIPTVIVAPTVTSPPDCKDVPPGPDHVSAGVPMMSFSSIAVHVSVRLPPATADVGPLMETITAVCAREGGREGEGN